jgi:hypothetical protein
MNAQSSWGIKGSVIFNSNGDLIDDATNVIESKGSGGSGFNVGTYGELDLLVIYLRAELLYSQSKSEYEIQSVNTDFKMSSMDLPVLVGVKIGPLKLFAGPAFKYIINSDLEGLDYESISSDITVGLNAGIAFQLGRLGIDLTYDRGFNDNEAEFIDGANGSFTLDTRPQQFRIGFSYRISKKK